MTRLNFLKATLASMMTVGQRPSTVDAPFPSVFIFNGQIVITTTRPIIPPDNVSIDGRVFEVVDVTLNISLQRYEITLR